MWNRSRICDFENIDGATVELATELHRQRANQSKVATHFNLINEESNSLTFDDGLGGESEKLSFAVIAGRRESSAQKTDWLWPPIKSELNGIVTQLTVNHRCNVSWHFQCMKIGQE